MRVGELGAHHLIGRVLEFIALFELRFDAQPVKGSHWARPELVVAVDFSEWTSDGRLRHPRFKAVLPDKAPTEVRRELP